MKVITIRLGYYRTTILQATVSGKNIYVDKKAEINCSKYFRFGNFSNLEEFAGRLKDKLRSEFHYSMLSKIVLVLPHEICLEQLVDGIDIEKKNKQKEILAQVPRSTNLGFNNIDCTKIGANPYSEMFLVTEYDGKRLNSLLENLSKKDIVVDRVVGPLYTAHHLARMITCPLEMTSQNNMAKISRTGSMLINTSLDRISYTFIHNNLPLEIRESAVTPMTIIEKMIKVGVSFDKATRLLRLIGVDGMSFERAEDVGDSEKDELSIIEDASFLFESYGEDSDETEDEDKPDAAYGSLYLESNETQSDRKKKSLSDIIGIDTAYKLRDMEATEKELLDDGDTYLTDEQYALFDDSLRELMLSLKTEIAKTVGYFAQKYEIRIASFAATTNDIYCLDQKIEEMCALANNTFSLQKDSETRAGDITIINRTKEDISSEYATNIAIVLCDSTKGDIYE